MEVIFSSESWRRISILVVGHNLTCKYMMLWNWHQLTMDFAYQKHLMILTLSGFIGLRIHYLSEEELEYKIQLGLCKWEKRRHIRSLQHFCWRSHPRGYRCNSLCLFFLFIKLFRCKGHVGSKIWQVKGIWLNFLQKLCIWILFVRSATVVLLLFRYL